MNLLRTKMNLLNKSQVKDGISTVSLLEKFGMLSVNQLNVQVKLLEMWKLKNIADYPLKIAKHTIEENKCTTRASAQGKLIEIGRSNTTKNTLTSDATRIWNMAPRDIIDSITVCQAKERIKTYAKTLPV